MYKLWSCLYIYFAVTLEYRRCSSVVERPLRMRKVGGSIPSISIDNERVTNGTKLVLLLGITVTSFVALHHSGSIMNK